MINLTQQYLPQSRALIDILWRVQVNKEGNTDCQVQSMINLFTEVRVCLTDSHHETRLIPGRTEEVASQCCLLEGENVTAGRQPPGGRTVDCGLWTLAWEEDHVQHHNRDVSSLIIWHLHTTQSGGLTNRRRSPDQNFSLIPIFHISCRGFSASVSAKSMI